MTVILSRAFGTLMQFFPPFEKTNFVLKLKYAALKDIKTARDEALKDIKPGT
jgi:hypothetical protein